MCGLKQGTCAFLQTSEPLKVDVPWESSKGKRNLLLFLNWPTWPPVPGPLVSLVLSRAPTGSGERAPCPPRAVMAGAGAAAP